MKKKLRNCPLLKKKNNKKHFFCPLLLTGTRFKKNPFKNDKNTPKNPLKNDKIRLYFTFTLFSYRYSGAMSISSVHITV